MKKTYKARHCATCSKLFIPTGNRNIHCSLLCRISVRWDQSEGNDACWIWKKRLNKAGYGIVDKSLAHRLVYSLLNGQLSDDDVVRHSCDNPSCVNPRHLLKGSHSDNIHDMWSRSRNKGFVNRGSAHGAAKIDEAIALAIFQSHGRMVDIAKKFQVSQGLVEQIHRGETWTHVTGLERLERGVKRGMRKGSGVMTAKLNEASALAIFQDAGTGVEIAAKFGVSTATVCNIKKGKVWKHVTTVSDQDRDPSPLGLDQPPDRQPDQPQPQQK